MIGKNRFFKSVLADHFLYHAAYVAAYVILRNLYPYSRYTPHLDDYGDVVAGLRRLSQICDKDLDRTFI